MRREPKENEGKVNRVEEGGVGVGVEDCTYLFRSIYRCRNATLSIA